MTNAAAARRQGRPTRFGTRRARRTASIFALAAVGLSTVLGAPTARAQNGFGVAPTAVDLGRVAPGGVVVDAITVINGDEAVTLDLDVRGDAAAWISLHPDEEQALLDVGPTMQSVVLDARQEIRIVVRAEVPEDAPVGPMSAVVRLRNRSETETSIGIEIPVALDVVRDGLVAGKLVDVEVGPVGAGDAAELAVRLRNTGTLAFTPEVAVSVRLADEIVHEDRIGGLPMAVGTDRVVSILLPDTLGAGDYDVVVSAAAAGTDLGTIESRLTVDPVGGIARSLEVRSFGVIPSDSADVVVVGALVENLGPVGALAVLEVDVVVDGAVVENALGTATRIDVGERQRISVPVAALDGDYVLAARVTAGGETVASREIDVADDGGVGSPAPRRVAIVSLVLAGAASITVMAWGWRSGHRPGYTPLHADIRRPRWRDVRPARHQLRRER